VTTATFFMQTEDTFMTTMNIFYRYLISLIHHNLNNKQVACTAQILIADVTWTHTFIMDVHIKHHTVLSEL